MQGKKKTDIIAQKPAKYFLCGAFKELFSHTIETGCRSLKFYSFNKASYIFCLNTQMGEASGLITSHDCVFFSCNIKFIACGSWSNVKLTGTTWSQLVSCSSYHWREKGTRTEASRVMSSLLGIPVKIRSEHKREQQCLEKENSNCHKPRLPLHIHQKWSLRTA